MEGQRTKIRIGGACVACIGDSRAILAIITQAILGSNFNDDVLRAMQRGARKTMATVRSGSPYPPNMNLDLRFRSGGSGCQKRKFPLYLTQGSLP